MARKHLVHVKSNQTVTVGDVTSAKLPTITGTPQNPNADDIVYGELAVNYKKGYETISTRNDNDEIVEFASKSYVDTKTANTKEVEIQASEPSDNGISIWIDTDETAPGIDVEPMTSAQNAFSDLVLR